MRFVILGAGAMGSLFAAHLARTGAQTWVVDRWREHIEAIRSAGLTVKHESGESVVRLNATTDASQPGPGDVVMVFVKYHQTLEALSAARALVGPRTVLLTLQNGLGCVEAIRQLFPANRIFYGLTTLTSEMLGPGRIEASYAGRGETYLWAHDGKRDAALEAVCSLLTEAGVNAALAPDIELRIWKKLIVNCSLNPLCAITRLPVGRLADRADAWPVLEGVVREIVAAAGRKGIPLHEPEALAFLRAVAHEARNHFPSMLIDVQSRRATEIDCLNGAVLEHCERFGIAAPFNRTLYCLIRLIEGSYGTSSHGK